MPTATDVLTVIADVLGTREVFDSPDLQLYELDLLDSLRTVELIVALSEQFGIDISPSDFDRDRWGSPQRIVEDVQRRVAATGAGHLA